MRKILILSLLVPFALYAAVGLFNAVPPMVNWKKDDVQQITLTNNSALTFKNGKVGSEYKLVVKQDAIGGRMITWPSDVQWPGGSAPTLTSTPNATDVIEFLYDGINYLGSYNLNYIGAPASMTLNSGLLHYWKLNETSGDALDSAGSLTLFNNNLAPFEQGLIGNAVHLNGTTQNFTTTNNLVFSAPTNYTFCSWISVDNSDPGNGYNFFLSYDENLSFRVTYINVEGVNQIRFIHVGSDGSNPLLNYPVTLIPSTWHHICGTWNNSNLVLYFDGLPVSSAVVSGAFSSAANLTSIGSSVDGNYFDGKIDEVGLWNRALTALDISQLYNGGAGRQYPF